MNVFSGLFKPAWQSPNVEKRAAAVADDDQPELLAALPRIAVEDTDAGVRRHALRRCADPALFAKAMVADADASLRDWAGQQWLAALIAGRCPASDEDLDRLGPDDREQVAGTARDSDLRRRALGKIQRQAFLAERILADPDAGIRGSLIERIDNPAALDRLAEQLRKSSKQLSRAARERAESLRLAQGDGGARDQRADAICAGLERLFRTPMEAGQRQRQLSDFERQWQALDPDTLAEPLRVRFEGARQVLQVQLQPPAPPAPPAETVADDLSVDEEPVPTAEEIAAQAKLESELARIAADRERDREQAAREREAVRERQTAQAERVTRLTEALDAGDLGSARALAAELEPDHLTASDRRRWNALQPRLKQLQGWESWANNKVRSRLCADIERLIGSGLHPDAISGRIRETQQQWRELDALEGRDDSGEPTGLDKRFRIACSRALKPARGFFDKRDAIRSELKDQISAFLADARTRLAGVPPAAPASDDTDPDAPTESAMTEPADDVGDAVQPSLSSPELMSLQRKATEHLRSLDQIAGNDRRKLTRQLRDLLDQIRPQLEALFDQAASARDALIAAAEGLGQETEARAIATKARQLNEQWKQIGKGRPGRDQRQWRQFRAALDRVFAGLDQRRQQQRDDVEEQLRQAQAVVSELESLACQSGDALAGSEAAVRALRERWRELSPRDRGLNDRFDSALTRHRDALRDLARQQARERLLALLPPPGPTDTGDGAEPARVRARELLFEAESLVGIDAPEEEREERRLWQLRRLQDHLRGERREHSAQDALAGLLDAWRKLDGLDAGDRERGNQRLRRVIERA